MFALLTLSSTSAMAGTTSGGGANASPWEVTLNETGMDTYTYPVSDEASPGGYRMSTKTYNWATKQWQIDGISFPSTACFPTATWNTPAAFTGSAKSEGTKTYKVKWVGAGTPPTYMYLALGSTASAAELSDSVPATVSGSNGQNDPFIVSFGGAGVSTGIHAKKLKLGSGGEATYSISLNAKSTKTAKIANLGASCGTSYNLEPKALGLFRETYKRNPDNNVQGPVISERASTGDVEREQAQVGISTITFNGPILWPPSTSDGWDPTPWTTGDLSTDLAVDRVGNWLSATGSFSSSIDSGTRSEVYPPTIASIAAFQSYSGTQIASMRESGVTFNVTVDQGDPGSIIPGPFHGTIAVKVWAPERIMEKIPYDEAPVIRYLNLAGGANYQDVTPAEDTTVIVGTTDTNETSQEYSVVTGPIAGIPLPLIGIGVKFDCGFKLGFKHIVSSYGGTSTRLDHPSVTTRVRFKTATSRHMMHRYLAKYGASGYDGDFLNDIANVAAPTIGSGWEFTFPSGS